MNITLKNGPTFRWVAWVLVTAQPKWLDTIDAMMANPGGYKARFHLCAPTVGGYGGRPGQGLCGSKVPEDNPDNVLLWETPPTHGVPYCKRCTAALERLEKKSGKRRTGVE